VQSIHGSVYNAATTPAIAMAAAAKLPTLYGPPAAAPVELALDPEPVLLAALPEVADPVAVRKLKAEEAAPVAEVTMVVVQLQSEL